MSSTPETNIGCGCGCSTVFWVLVIIMLLKYAGYLH
jgi:hypothetical protein